MVGFIRKNQVVLSGVFNTGGWCPPGWSEPDPPAPTSVTAVLRYKNLSGEVQTDNVNLSVDDRGVWSCTWDTSASGPGRVDWTVYSAGPVVASTQGFFYVDANPANIEA